MAGLVRKINHISISDLSCYQLFFVSFRNNNWFGKIEIDLIVTIHSDMIQKFLKIFLATDALSEMLPIQSYHFITNLVFYCCIMKPNIQNLIQQMQNLTRQGQTVS